MSLIIGPAGAGKSTLLDQWVRATDQDVVARVDLGSAEAPVLARELHRGLGLSPAAGPFDPERAGVAIGEALAVRAGGLARSVVIVDSGSTRLSEPQVVLLDGLVRAGRGTLRLVVAARSVPGFVLGYLAGAGGFGTIGPEELSFDRAEIERVARARLGRALDPDELDDLANSHRGWVAAVLLALAAPIVLGGEGEEISSVRAQPLIDDFVVREVLGVLDTDQRQLLFDVAAWDPVVPSVCDAVLHRADSRRRLEQIAELVTFVEREPEPSLDFRLARDFAGVLRREARRRDPRRVATLNHDAAVYHRVRGERLDALAVLAASEQWDELLEGLSAVVLEPEYGPELSRARALAASVPREVLHTHPAGLQTMVALDLLVGDVETVDALLAELRERIDGGGPDQWAVRAFWHGAQAVMGPWRDDVAEPLAHAHATLALLDQFSAAFSSRIDEPPFSWARCLVLVFGSSSQLRAGHFDTAREWIDQGAKLAESVGRVDLQVVASGFAAVWHAMLGALSDAVDHAERTWSLAERFPNRTVLKSGADHAAALVALERNRLDVAEHHLDSLVGAAFPHPSHTRAVIGLLAAQLLFARGEVRAALHACDRLRAPGAGPVPVDLEPALVTTQVRLAVADGQFEHARQRLAAYRGTSPVSAAAALVALVEGDRDQLAAELAAWPSPVGTRERIEREVFAALWADRVGDDAGRRTHLLAAAELAEPEGFRRVFLDVAPGVVELVVAEHERNPAPVLARLLDRLSGHHPAAPGVSVPEFTPAEVAVVELLATYLSAGEMAARLGVSVSALKSRQRSVYRKLGVRSRSDAVARLVELGAVSGA